MAPAALLGLGTNLGDRRANLHRGVSLLAQAGVAVVAASALYETPPWGVEDQPVFLNAVLSVATDLEPRDLLMAIKGIEVKVGRVPGERWGPRVLDIDILYYGDRVIDEPDLQVPHPRIAERAFVLVPLAELAPDLLDPRTARTVREMLVDRDDAAPVIHVAGPDWASP